MECSKQKGVNQKNNYFEVFDRDGKFRYGITSAEERKESLKD